MFSNFLYFWMTYKVVFWLITAIFTLLVGVIAFYNINNHMIWVTAIIGSYVCIVSVSIFCPDYKWPIVMNLPALEEAGALTEVQTSYYIYVGIWIISSALGILF